MVNPIKHRQHHGCDQTATRLNPTAFKDFRNCHELLGSRASNKFLVGAGGALVNEGTRFDQGNARRTAIAYLFQGREAKAGSRTPYWAVEGASASLTPRGLPRRVRY